MTHVDLLTLLARNHSFAGLEDAEHALTTSLETLGYLLSVPVLHELEAGLPRSCSGPLSLGRSASENARRLAHSYIACEPGELPQPVVQRIHDVCGTLAGLLSPELVRRIVHELPPSLQGAFRPNAGIGLQSSSAGATMVAQHTCTPESVLTGVVTGTRS